MNTILIPNQYKPVRVPLPVYDTEPGHVGSITDLIRGDSTMTRDRRLVPWTCSYQGETDFKWREKFAVAKMDEPTNHD